jgi:hypothetical protein
MIPKQFDIFGETIKIVHVDYLLNDDQHIVNGLCECEYNRISLSNRMAKDHEEAIFYHELVHMLLDKIEEDDLSSDEKFVVKLAGVLHQFMITKK